MINLKKILKGFTDEKQQEFISFLNKKNKRKDAKNIVLTKLLLSEKLTLKEICFELYNSNNKVAFHGLRKRLFDSIIDFTANSNLKEENSTDMKLIKLISSARTFLQKGQYKVGYKILEKAEYIAKENQLYTILNEIYHSKIEYAHKFNSEKIDIYEDKFRSNLKHYQLEEELNIAHSKIRIVLNEIQHHNRNINIKNLINNTLTKQNITISDSLSFKSLYQLIQITSISTSQNFEFWNIESFLIETYEIIKIHKSKDKQLFYHLEVLYLISNTLFRNKKFIESLNYLDEMHNYMQKQKNKYFKEFELKYYLLLSLNNNYNGNQQKAISNLEIFIDKKNTDTTSLLDIYLSLIVFYFQNNSLKKAQNLMSKFYHTDKWYIDKVGLEWTVKKNLIEILLHIDIGNIDIVESRILSFKRTYFKHLKEINQEKVVTFLQLVESYYKNQNIASNKEFIEKVENSFNFISRDKEDVFIMSFFAWLKAKMTKQDVYLVTLDLVNNR